MSTSIETVIPTGGEDSSTRDFQFTITLFGGRLATVKTPVPMNKRNLERLKRMIEDQLKPFITDLDEDEPEAV